MSLSIGIVGLPNVGKSTLFKALTKKQIDIANYPFCTIDPNVGVVKVPDERLDKLTAFSKSEKTLPTAIEFTDIAGLVKGAADGEGLGNKFLSHIRETDAICHLVRCFEDSDVTHVHGKIDPQDDTEVINTELIIADLETITKTISRLEKQVKSKDKEAEIQLPTFKKVKEALEDNRPAYSVSLDKEELPHIRQANLLTYKPILYVGNIAEDEINTPDSELAKKYNLPENSIFISVKIEQELSELSPEDQKEYLKDLSLTQSGLDKIILASYKLLNLITFITTGPQETRAWTITKNSKAPQAAGKIHTDFQRGFIAAEVIPWEQLLESGSHADAVSKGLIRTEGKEYIVQDGDVVEFKFNV